MKPKTTSIIVLITSLLTACLPKAATEQPAYLTATSQPTDLPATHPATAVPTEISAPPGPGPEGPVAGWTEYRDPRFGYAITLPCYWRVFPTPMDGKFAAMTARSYSEGFFAAHSERGEWAGNVWPEGVYMLDFVVFEDIDPSLSTQDAIQYVYANYSPEQELASVQEMTFGRHQGFISTVASGLQGGETVRVVQFRLGPSELASVVFQPANALDSSDVKAILSSIALTADELVAYPTESPAGPPDGGSATCQ